MGTWDFGKNDDTPLVIQMRLKENDMPMEADNLFQSVQKAHRKRSTSLLKIAWSLYDSVFNVSSQVRSKWS